MESYERRLPVYLLLDVSESMLGEGMEALQKGLSALMMDLHGSAQALESAWVSVITFAGTAEQVVPLTELARARIPPLRCRPGTALGGALALLADCIRREVRTQGAGVKGDWKPLVFLLTDGLPTDGWEEPAERLREMAGSHPANLVAIGCGDEADPYVLMRLSGTVLLMRDDPDTFSRLFQWISSSIAATSRAVAAPEPGPVQLEKLPAGVERAPTAVAPRPRPRLQPLLFLPLRCSRGGRPYVVRYRLDEELGGYVPVRAHVVDEDFSSFGDPGTAFEVSSRQILGIVACPHCRAGAAVRCPCGQLSCVDDESVFVCPRCEQTLEGTSASDDVSLSARLG